jgi:RIO-like serine/threonine protein kinase
MQYDISVLRAILRLSRHRRQVDLAAITLRVAGELPELRDALRRLEQQGLVVREPDIARLTLQGLAVAVASIPARSKPARAPRRLQRAA